MLIRILSLIDILGYRKTPTKKRKHQPELETDDFPYGDPVRNICLLCQRQFPSAEDLKRHNDLSALHSASCETFGNRCVLSYPLLDVRVTSRTSLWSKQLPNGSKSVWPRANNLNIEIGPLNVDWPTANPIGPSRSSSEWTETSPSRATFRTKGTTDE